MEHQSTASVVNRALAPILSPRRLSEITGLAPATIWRMRRRGDLPEPIRLSPGRVGWPEDVIRTWLAERAAERA